MADEIKHPFNRRLDARLVAYVWWCGDEWCDCYQPIIQAHHRACRHLTIHGEEFHRVEGPYLWQGEFETDGGEGVREELEATLHAMAKYWPDVYQTTITL